VPIVQTGPLCARRGCNRPEWGQGLCHACWRLARLFAKDPLMFAFEPMDGYRDRRDSVELPWERWEQEARARGMAIADILAEGGASDEPPRPGA